MTASISLFLGTVMLSGPLAYAVWTFLSKDTKVTNAVKENLRRAAPPVDVEGQENDGLFLRLGRKITPEPYVRKLDRMLALAGRPSSIPLGRVLAAKPALAITGGSAGVFLASVSDAPSMKLIGVAILCFGYFIPDLLLMSKGQERQKAIQTELANTLDQMLIGVEAGLGFEGALARAGENGKGPLAEEIVRTLQDMQVGRSRRESYLALAERTNVPELKSFVQAVVQADAYGIAIGSVLRVQAKVMRVKRRQRAEEKAMKLPVKVLFPLLFFIFPVLFIAILGPAVINSIETFSGQ
jgi:tight adherence protein C